MTDCYDCVGNCQRCPIECQFISVYNENKKKINKSVMLPSSQYLNIKKGMITSRHVGQSANPKKLLQTGSWEMAAVMSRTEETGEIKIYSSCLFCSSNRLSS